MADMKTPDFDDLLAAFDIPDMVDPKTAIESGHEDTHDGQLKHPSVPHEDPHDGQLKHPSVPHEDEAHTPSGGPDVGVSVIVKNVHKMDAGGEEHIRPEKEVQAEPTTMVNHNGLHNGYLSMSPNDRHSKNNRADKTLRDVEAHHGLAISSNFVSHSTFNQFSPISSAEEFDDDDKIEVDDSLDRVKQSALPCFRTNPLTEPPAKREEQLTTKAVLADSHSTAKPGTKSKGDCEKSKLDKNNNTLVTVSLNLYDSSKSRKLEEEKAKETTAPRPQEGSGREAGEPCVQSVSTSLSQAKQANSSAKLSSCIAAIAALSAKKATVSDTTNSVVSESPPTTQRDSSTTIPTIHTQREAPKEAKERESPRVLVPEKSPDQESTSALEVARRLQSKQPESPSSPTTSEDSIRGSGSPSSSPSTPVIPKVRIKTIKTSSGQIKRTVTRVLPSAQVESDAGRLKKGSSIMVSSFLSSPTSSSVFSSPTSTRTSSLPTTTPGGGPGIAMESNKQMTIKPVATAFL
ncbi:unnamed protein product, partial [Coregonus sp. 'balchen']